MRKQPARLEILAALFALFSIHQGAFALDPGSPPPDMRKSVIESPTKSILKGPDFSIFPAISRSNALPADMSKYRIEKPTKSLISQPQAYDARADMRKGDIESPVKINISAGPGPAARNSRKANKVEPGLVSWHESFASAMKVAQSSGKPVLLFQMMGYLDDRFC